MTDFDELMAILSLPRPNGSSGERATRKALQDWLSLRGIPFQVHRFRLFPYFFETIGAWMILSRTLLGISIWLRWGWLSLIIACLGLVGGLGDFLLHLPIISWLGMCWGENILVQYAPAHAEQEVILCAHYDSKTELLDHRQRMFFLKGLPVGIGLTVLLGMLGPFDHMLLTRGSGLAVWTYWGGVILSIPLLLLAWGLGLNLLVGRWLPPSLGAVDNGAACAILLGLAEQLHNTSPAQEQEGVPASAAEDTTQFRLQRTKVTLAWFSGEEADRQGSRAFARQRSQTTPTAVINLEAMAQDGAYVYWEQDGSLFSLKGTSPLLNQALVKAVRQVTGEEPVPGGPVLSDAASFQARGLPVAILGSYDRRLVDTGFHRPSDNLERIVMARLPEGVEILKYLLLQADFSRAPW